MRLTFVDYRPNENGDSVLTTLRDESIYFDGLNEDWREWSYDHHGAKLRIEVDDKKIRLILEDTPFIFPEHYYYVAVLFGRYGELKNEPPQ